MNGSARVEVTWANGAIEDKWLQVTVKADSVTGLAGADVFYWGNKQGDCTGDGIDNSADLQQVLADDNTGPWPVTKSDDFNKDTFVNSADLQIVNFYSNTLIPMITTPVQARSYYATSYYDAADRLTDQVNVGTNGGTPYSRPALVPPGSNTVLVTHTDYDNGGRVLDTVDPRGIKQGDFYDLLGNTLDTIGAWDGTGSAGSLPTVGNASNQITQYTYDGNGDVLSMTAMQPTGGSTPNQTTGYDYGVNTGTGGGIGSGSAINSNDLLAAVLYPDPTNGKAGGVDPGQSPVMSDVVLNACDLQGETTQMTDRDGNVHGYTYDVLGRLKLDSVTTLGAGVDGTIRALGYNYTALGLPYQQTSYSNAAGTSVVNQVEDAYNGYGQLTQQYQEHSGAVTGSSLSVQYGYSQPTGANYSRLSTMTYPNTRVLDYVYNTGLDSDISRVSGISDASGTGAGNDQSYLYLGLDTIVQATDGNGIALSYIKQPGDTLAGSDAGDQYTGLDRFGRVDDQNWVNTSTGVSTDRFQYGYDQNGNVLYKNNLVNSTFSELYHANSTIAGDNNTDYDNLNRIAAFRRGTLSASSYNGGVLDTVSTLNSNADSSQSWTLDALGNQTSVTTDGTATGRTINSQNQIAAIGSTSLAYDNNGNTTTDENGHTLIYDAWNRLIEVKNGSTVLASYVYDANGNRVQQTESSATTDLYYSTRGQVLEERQSGTVTAQNVWGLMYVNQLVERDDNSTSGNYGFTGSGLGRRVFVQQDANWNVTALVGSTGTVLQRADYTPYGIQTILSPSWATATDAYGVPYSFQGGRQDPVTGLVHFSQGNPGRDFDVHLGTVVEQDPAIRVSRVWLLAGRLQPNLQPRLLRSQLLDPMLMQLTRARTGYINSFNRYQVEGSNPIQRVDPSGRGWVSDQAPEIIDFIFGAIGAVICGVFFPEAIGVGFGFAIGMLVGLLPDDWLMRWASGGTRHVIPTREDLARMANACPPPPPNPPAPPPSDRPSTRPTTMPTIVFSIWGDGGDNQLQWWDYIGIDTEPPPDPTRVIH